MASLQLLALPFMVWLYRKENATTMSPQCESNSKAILKGTVKVILKVPVIHTMLDLKTEESTTGEN